jgi:hypothetical protein
VFALRRDVITISVRLSDEEQALLEKLLKKYGHGWPLPKTLSDRFRFMLRNIGNRPWEHVFEPNEETEAPSV